MSPWSVGAAGLFLVVGGAIPWFAAPGYPREGFAAIEMVPSIAVFLLGVVFLAFSAARYRAEIRAAPAPTAPESAPPASRAGAVSMVGGALLLLVVMLLLSAGVVPGWYLPSTGDQFVPITGCGGVVAHPSSGFPDGFPPSARVILRWMSVNATRVTVGIYQSPPNSPATTSARNTLAAETGSSGGSAFTGDGGAFWVQANSTGSCPRAQSVLVSWTYDRST
ncbi:MAG: hypothetical protein WAK40_00375 [Thermoplasmata archaeon]